MDTSQVTIDQQGDLAVLTIDTPMLTSLEADRLLTSLRQYHEQTGCVFFAIEMSGLDFIDSACIGSLVTFLIEIDKLGGKLILAACQRNVAELMKITGLTTHIPLLPSIEQAVAEYGGQSRTE